MTVVGEVTNVREAISLCCQLQPELVQLDLCQPDMDGITATNIVTQLCPATSVIIRTSYQNPDHLTEALEAGAAAYLLQAANPQQIVQAAWQLLQSAMLLK